MNLDLKTAKANSQIVIARCPNPECGEQPVLATRSNVPSFYILCPHCCYTGPYKRDPGEAKRLHNLICKSAAIPWHDLPMANIELADAIIQEWQKRVESGSPAMPWGTSELVELISRLRPAHPPTAEYTLRAELWKIVEEWRALVGPTRPLSEDNESWRLLECADELEALLADRSGGER